jgi:hypothetical protein
MLAMSLDERSEVKEQLVAMDGPTKKRSRFRMESKDDFDRDSQRPSLAERTYDKTNDVYRERIMVGRGA